MGLAGFKIRRRSLDWKVYVTDVHFAVEQGLGFIGFRAQGLGLGLTWLRTQFWLWVS